VSTVKRPVSVKAVSLVLDYSLHPRHRLDDVTLRRLSSAVEAGKELPPVVADRSSRRVTDGFHRVTIALRRDENAEVPVEWVDYPNEQEMFLDAVRRNAEHGSPLSPYDFARVLLIADDYKIDAAAVAAALSVPIAALDRIKVSRVAFSSSGKPVAVKRSFRGLSGSHITEHQEQANRRASGWGAAFHAEQIVLLIDAGVVDWDDPRTREALDRLTTCLSQHLVET
jgi:hypothetical protein